MSESYRLPNGQAIVNVHDVGRCVGHYCVIHNPSAHHMRHWPLNWRNDSKVFERVCEHGTGHPDPDQRDFFARTGRSYLNDHGCDGCCRDDTIDGEVVVREIEAPCTPGVIRFPDNAKDLLRQWFAWWRDSPDAPAKMPGSLHTRTATYLVIDAVQRGVTLNSMEDIAPPMSITCDTCGMTSHNPNDVRERYCGNCHTFADEASD